MRFRAIGVFASRTILRRSFAGDARDAGGAVMARDGGCARVFMLYLIRACVGAGRAARVMGGARDVGARGGA